MDNTELSAGCGVCSLWQAEHFNGQINIIHPEIEASEKIAKRISSAFRHNIVLLKPKESFS